MAMIRIDDQFELAYEESGTGRPIVFIHGVWMSVLFFTSKCRRLENTTM